MFCKIIVSVICYFKFCSIATIRQAKCMELSRDPTALVSRTAGSEYIHNSGAADLPRRPLADKFLYGALVLQLRTQHQNDWHFATCSIFNKILLQTQLLITVLRLARTFIPVESWSANTRLLKTFTRSHSVTTTTLVCPICFLCLN